MKIAKETWDWLIDRLSENSTWRGIIALLTAAGVVLGPEQAEKIIAAGLALIGVINVLRKGPQTNAPTVIVDQTKPPTTTT